MRFSLKTLLATVCVTSVVCGIFFALPYWASLCILVLFWFLVPPTLIAGIVYGRGYGRAFCIGCISTGGCVPLLYMYMVAIMFSGLDVLDELDAESAAGIKIAFAAATILVGISGFASVCVRWLSLRCSSEDTPRSSKPASKEYSVLQGRVTTMKMTSTPVASDSSAGEVGASSPSSSDVHG